MMEVKKEIKYIADIINQLLEENNLTYFDLSCETDISHHHIKLFLIDKEDVKMCDLFKICEFVGLKLNIEII